ncbi:F-box protein [Canna indica]|uniref:F-box protein n=1 Tax=Canna indica TaxID=4628 RepID=A0AAQ3Q562_9LILI|nr:F-box protein [Canna indica]
MENDHKLCGFIQVVLSASSVTEAPSPGDPCSPSTDGPNVGFRSQEGAALLLPLPVPPPPGEDAAAALSPDKTTAGVSSGAVTPASSASKRRRRRVVGLVKGSMSAVHQLHVLTSRKCLKIDATVVRISARGDAEVRVVVLIDLYLPIAVWSGWQFGRSGPLAACLFKHASCNWQVRNSLLAFDRKANNGCNWHDDSIWNCADCHILDCKMHCTLSGSDNRNRFDIHGLFKSLPSIGKEKKIYSTRISPDNEFRSPGIWDISDDVLTNVLNQLGPKDLISVAATCRHLRSLAVPIMPCMKLKLFPHQEAAVEWMLKRERHSAVLPHPLYLDFLTEDGFSLYMNSVSGEISTGMTPTLYDFRGGMFCDEPGLGKTITALSLILKTYGTVPDPPQGIGVMWCMHNMDQRCGYYELVADNLNSVNYTSKRKRSMSQNLRRGEAHFDQPQQKNGSIEHSCILPHDRGGSMNSEFSKELADSSSCTSSDSTPVSCILRSTRSLNQVKRNLLSTYGKEITCSNNKMDIGNLVGCKKISAAAKRKHGMNEESVFPAIGNSYKKPRKEITGSDSSETWVQCDACRKWRKISESSLDTAAAWFCSMNSDPLHQNCCAPEESWDSKRRITCLPGFYTKGTEQGNEQNISFFTSVLKEHFTLINSETNKALNWLADLSERKFQEMEKNGLTRTIINEPWEECTREAHGYHKIFQAFGLVRKFGHCAIRWHYPSALDNLAFDAKALKIALTKPLNPSRLYLSKATLIIVPANLVDHWVTQIQKHVRPGQLCVYVWTDNKKPSVHNLAWDYDIVITTFNKLSAEWGPRKRSVLMQVHWLRIMLDEGHTLGSSLSLTNKLQMAVSLTASSRWILTGTPTPNTPNSQVAHLQPMLKFLHDETYGQNQESWEAGILRPFEAQMEEGRLRLFHLLERIMISARKIDLKNIPPCIRKIAFLHFTEEHAWSYNELVLTVRRNILMADWNDPSHVESLLNPKQWKLRGSTIRNVRLSCCVAGHIKVTNAGQDIQETMDMLSHQGVDPLSEEYMFIKNSLLNGCNCYRCKNWCRLPIITPCRHLLCLDCIALDSTRCTLPGCGNPYEMQSPETLARPENPNPKWPVPKDLIELQPSYKQDEWDPDWQSTCSSKVAYLVERLRSLREANQKIGYSLEGTDKTKMLIYGSKTNCCFLSQQVDGPMHNMESCKTPTEKVIVFSQFLEHIHVIEQQLTVAGINFARMYSPMHSSNKMKSLTTFQLDPNCMVLLMDGSAALGLDLSFVAHVFLMEPIWDRSMEEQVISRAHRMGATRPINVETLAMHGTIEEQMLNFLQDSNTCGRALKQEVGKDEYEGMRSHRTVHDFAESNYLAQLSFVRTSMKT